MNQRINILAILLFDSLCSCTKSALLCHLSYATTEIYYTHTDHLGSAAWITDKYSNPEQYLHYLPYGQLLANQKATTYDERYKFIGKERDWESGYDYFGARYYMRR